MKKKKNSRGFTLIELLAVIIILGILMIIAIPSVTSYINNSRKSAYIDTAREIISGARNLVNEGKLEMFDTGTTYYIPVSCVSTENGQKSPYGDFVEDQAFVVVTYTGKNYNYFWISRDTTGQGVKTITPVGELDEDDIKSDISANEITPTEPAETGKTTIKVLSKDDCKTFGEGSGGENGAVVYPTGKNKTSVEIGDVVTIGTEDFYVIKTTSQTSDGSLVLFAKYNLKVGNIYNSSKTKIGEYTASDPGYGLQSSEAKGYVSGASTYYGTMYFSNSIYWSQDSNSHYVYNNNCNLYTYIEAYKEKLEEMGATIKEAKLISFEEADSISGTEYSYMFNSSSYWTGTVWNNLMSVVQSDVSIQVLETSFDIDEYSNYVNIEYGVRPVIII